MRARKFFARFWWVFVEFPGLLLSTKSYLRKTGWLRSVLRGAPCDADGLEIPWMNFPIVSFLRDRLTEDCRIFEYGSGDSTLFFARHTGRVISVEHDRDWFEVMKPRLPANVSLHLQPEIAEGGYAGSIRDCEGEFDVVIVDGRDRVACVRQAAEKLSARGVIILDDSDRARYLPALQFAEDSGLRALHFEGLKPLSNRIERTSIFYREGNCLGI